MKRTLRSRERGVTLIELAITTVVASLAMSAIALTSFNWHRFYNRQLDAAEGQQNARVSLSVFKDYVTRAGYGFVAHTDLQGLLPIGGCFTDSGLDSLDCNGVDDGADRLRVYYGDSDGMVRTREGDTSTGTGMDGIPIADQTIWDSDPHDGVDVQGKYAFISGQCDSADGTYGSDVVRITGDSPGNRNAFHNYDFENINTGGPEFLGCPDGYLAFNFGLVSIADFYLDKSNARHPVLKLRVNDPTGDWEEAMALSTDIDTIQIEYGIDDGENGGDSSKTRPDGLVDMWCDDPRGSGDCNSAGFSDRELQARIVAIRIAIVARTRQYRQDLNRLGDHRLFVQDHMIPDRSDGYNRYVYRSTVSMRNNDIILKDGT